MSAWNLPARMLAVPLSTAVASCMFFLIPVMSSSGTSVHGALPVLGIFLIIGAIIGLIVGCPLVLLVDGIFPRWRLRYIVFGAAGALVGWLVLDGGFARGAWEAIWSNPNFWVDWAPRRLILFSLIGVMSGLLYTAFVRFIDRAIPRDTR